MPQPRMFMLASTFAKIDSGLKAKNVKQFLSDLEREATSATGVFEAMSQDGDIGPFLISALRDAVCVTRDAYRQALNEYPQVATRERDIALARATMSVYRLWNAIDGRNFANIAMYSLLAKHQLCDFIADLG